MYLAKSNFKGTLKMIHLWLKTLVKFNHQVKSLNNSMTVVRCGLIIMEVVCYFSRF